jgi:hypothetical protein
MSKKIVLLQRNKGDDAKANAIGAKLKPLWTCNYNENGVPPTPPQTVQGEIDYLLVTGGHGDFVSGQPAKLNGLAPASARKWAGALGAEFDAIVLDTCFSTSFIPAFLGNLRLGGCIVCAHGSGEGWTQGLLDLADKGKSVGEALSATVEGVDSMGLGYSSISLIVRGTSGLKLFTANAGSTRKSGLGTRSSFGMDHDSEKELDQLDRFLLGRNILVEQVDNGALKTKLERHLAMDIA